MFDKLRADIDSCMEKDPAARSRWEVLTTYAGVKALAMHRRANFFYRHKMKYIARVISMRARRRTGIEIHPAAKIGSGVFIDHGTGVVIGETAEVGNNVVIFQGVTLGGTGKDTGKRHPTVEDDVMISSGAKVLGPITIGKGSKIGAGSVVLRDVPPYSTVVGVPGRVVKRDGRRIHDMDQIALPDPVIEEFARLNRRIEMLENKLGIVACKYSITKPELVDEEIEKLLS